MQITYHHTHYGTGYFIWARYSLGVPTSRPCPEITPWSPLVNATADAAAQVAAAIFRAAGTADVIMESVPQTRLSTATGTLFLAPGNATRVPLFDFNLKSGSPTAALRLLELNASIGDADRHVKPPTSRLVDALTAQSQHV